MNQGQQNLAVLWMLGIFAAGIVLFAALLWLSVSIQAVGL